MSGSAWRLGLLVWIGAACRAAPSLALTVTSVSPDDYAAVPLTEGTTYFLDSSDTLTRIPLALAGGTLVRTAAAGGPAGVAVSFQIDVRAEVYVCWDPRASAPAWVSSWLATGMTAGVADAAIGGFNVYARRFDAGVVTLPAGDSDRMYFIVVKASVPILPRVGWVVLSYDMPYLREIVRQAPLYNVNHLQISHDIMMYIYQPLEDAALRANLNELIDLAHAYGITDVTLWTHEFGTHGLPSNCRSGDGRVDGDNPATWAWTRSRYDQLFSTACPEVDGVVVTFDEVSMMGEGCEVWIPSCFKFNGVGSDAVQKVIQTVQASCHTYGKTFYARTWAGANQIDVRDGILKTNDTTTWMMSKNVGGDAGYDWQYMDTHLAVIGTVSDRGFNEMIEFDLCGEYLGRSRYTFIMTSYLKDHWNYALSHGVSGGAAARIDRQGSLTCYTANRINLCAMSRILADPAADPMAINLDWCRQYFPADVAQDIADHYDAPGSPWQGDTRYMTWEAFFPSLSPVTNSQARNIASAALGRIDRHRALLETQTTLDTRDGKTDYQTLRYGIALSILELGGTVPEPIGFSHFRPTRATSLNPDCSIDIRLATPGLDTGTAACEYSNNGGAQWNPLPVTCTGSQGSTATETITAATVPFNQASEDQNLIRFHVRDMDGVQYDSDRLKVSTTAPAIWTDFTPELAAVLTPDCTVTLTAAGAPLNAATARYQYSVDGGLSWVAPTTNWENRYECDVLPPDAGWTMVEGKTGYESVEDGLLHIEDTGTNWGDKVKYAWPWTVDPLIGATVLARVRCLSGGNILSSNLVLTDATHGEGLYLKGNGMIGLQQYGAIVPMNTQEWHTYRVTIRGDDINAYVDEDPAPIIRGNGAFIQPDGSRQLTIGSGASLYEQDIYYDYVYWTTQGAFAPTQLRPASCNGDGQSRTISATNVPFNQYSQMLNRIRFLIDSADGRTYQSPIYNVAISVSGVWADVDGDGDVDQTDFGQFQACLSGCGFSYDAGCRQADADSDGDVDQADFEVFQRCLSGPDTPVDPDCLK